MARMKSAVAIREQRLADYLRSQGKGEAYVNTWLERARDDSDGLSEEVYGFDIPVPAIGEDFDLALVGTKGTWYDHKVSVQNPEPMEEEGTDVPADGAYTCAVTLEGGSGRATVAQKSEQYITSTSAL